MAASTVRAPGIKPEPVPVKVKVVLVGEPDLWYALNDADPDFAYLFKVLVDFDDACCRRDPVGIGLYARVIARVARDEQLLPFSATAVGALVEHGAREAAAPDKLTARFGRVMDAAREAAFLARARGVRIVDRDDVDQALVAAQRRADLPGRKFRDGVARGQIRIRTRGEAVGEVNGLAVVQAGLVAQGFPTRITATAGPGTAGTVHVEREAELSGNIHTKGFLILRGLLRDLLPGWPLAFDASITHEQSYGGIDGDSASGAEFCCLLSALTRLPVRQSIAMTGAVDQHGNILQIGAVNEKIEGFFDVCAVQGLTNGPPGVIVPRSNAGDLQLRREVVHACRAGRFAVWAVDRIEEAVELLFGVPAGAPTAEGRYPEGTVLHRAAERAERLWRLSQPPREGR
ncbi:MAG: Lon-insertion domain-containing protein [Myxococcota bacterium]